MKSAKWIEEQLASSTKMYHELPLWIREAGSTGINQQPTNDNRDINDGGSSMIEGDDGN